MASVITCLIILWFNKRSELYQWPLYIPKHNDIPVKSWSKSRSMGQLVCKWDSMCELLLRVRVTNLVIKLLKNEAWLLFYFFIHLSVTTWAYILNATFNNLSVILWLAHMYRDEYMALIMHVQGHIFKWPGNK